MLPYYTIIRITIILLKFAVPNKVHKNNYYDEKDNISNKKFKIRIPIICDTWYDWYVLLLMLYCT